MQFYFVVLTVLVDYILGHDMRQKFPVLPVCQFAVSCRGSDTEPPEM
jgi:hypothetical protein